MSPLTDRDTNVQATSNPFQTNQTSGMDGAKTQQENAQQQHQQLLEQKAEGKNGGTYISPSDAIMSPASKKLESFKQRQINKQHGGDSTRRALFARNMSANSDKSDGGLGK